VDDRVSVTLRLTGRSVAEYRDGGALPAAMAPRPYLHPVRTLGGTPVTDAQPADHPWHLGLSVALQDVDGGNFWGGPTYVRDVGYTARDDHGRIEHDAFVARQDDGFIERLRWVTPRGEPLLAELRSVRAHLVGDGWELNLRTTLTNVTSRTVTLGSPATNGRDGAGYGGLFWRLPLARKPEVRAGDAVGEHAVHGAVAPWLAWTDHTFTLVLATAADATRADPWFVRVADYPGVGLQLAVRRPVHLSPGHGLTRGLRALVADGALDDQAAAEWAARG
jgi:hypothetical protein